MNILYVITLPDLGGAQVHLLSLATAAREKGATVHVVIGASGWLSEALSARGISVAILPSLVREISPLEDVQAVAALRREIRSFRPDIVHCHSSKAGIVGRLASWLSSVPAIFTAHGWAFTEGVSPKKRRIYQIIESVAGYWAEKLICVSDYDRRLGETCLPMHRDKMCTIYNGVADSPHIRAEGARDGTLRLIMVARFASPKRQVDVIRAVGIARERGRDVRIDFVGDGVGMQGAEVLCTQLALGDAVQFLGNRIDVEQLLPQYDGFVLASDWEGFPISILEAMRAGLPVIASDVGGVSEAVTHDETGWLVPKGSVELLADAVMKAADDRVTFYAMGQAGRERFLQYFTDVQMFSRVWAIYEITVRA